ncbi:DNA-binding response regulator [Clostridium sp. chh4-2]|uniref:LytR/AlgR family response regulator transcription factor n=1 Tax=Clostridium sp. chh4-2 TaxID=2067550 RepID=UPI000CCEF840|nr:LytTR family DNA-binding domain-containing protein [Clostridium sp. chh4-2]PNV59502.1 DNA-binding response regulator [Clostridium sp. chh4-2]
MIRFAVCDDQQEFTDKERQIIDKYCRDNGIAAEIRDYTDSKMLLYDIQENTHFDMLLLDIEMPQMNGMELASMIREKLPQAMILFVTSHTKYAIKAFELSVFRYIPKAEMDQSLPLALFDGLNMISWQDRECYLIESPRKVQKINICDLVYIYKKQKYAILVTKEEEIPVRKSLNQVLSELNREEFLMIERGFIINLYYVMKMEGAEVVLRGGIRLPVGGSYQKEVRDKIAGFWRKRL